jgi:UDP-GlcNAc:undecaprenyl-phosphate/decaprenyl-phosphate GlcNAc-1-phosphate transferase
VRDYVLTLLVAAAVTYMLTPLVRRAAIRFGVMYEPRERDMHKVPVPRGGGVAMYLGLAAGLLVAHQIPKLGSAFGSTGMVSGLLLAGGLLVVIGIIDDKWDLSALTQAAGQVAAGAILVATGTTMPWLPLPGGGTFVLTTDQYTLLTILIVVATINAVNFIDGLDGLAAGIVAIAAVSFLIYYYSLSKIVGISALAAPALASAILAGVCLGFLPHNFHPARIFMGTPGSMLLGLVLAYAPISSIASLPPVSLTSQVNRYPEIMPLLLPAAILVIPYADMLLAVIRRTRVGLSPFAADSKHLHHRLISIGHSQRASVLVMYLWAALFSGSIVWFSLEKTHRTGAANHHGQPIVVFVVITVAALLALVLLSMPMLRKRDRAARAELAATGGPAAPAVPERALASVNSGSSLPAPVVVGGRGGQAARQHHEEGGGPARVGRPDDTGPQPNGHLGGAPYVPPRPHARSAIGSVPPAAFEWSPADGIIASPEPLRPGPDQATWQARPGPDVAPGEPLPGSALPHRQPRSHWQPQQGPAQPAPWPPAADEPDPGEE